MFCIWNSGKLWTFAGPGGPWAVGQEHWPKQTRSGRSQGFWHQRRFRWTQGCGLNMTPASFTGTKWGRRVGQRWQGLLTFLRVFVTRPVWFLKCQRHFSLWMPIVKLDTDARSLIYPYGWMFLWSTLRKRKNAQIFHLSPVEPKHQRTSGLRVNSVGRAERCWSVVVISFPGGNTLTTAGFTLPKWHPGCGAGQRCAQVQEPSTPLQGNLPCLGETPC